MISFADWKRKRIGPVVFERVLTWRAMILGAFLLCAWIIWGTVYVIVFDPPDTLPYVVPWTIAMAYPTLRFVWRLQTTAVWSPICRPRWRPQRKRALKLALGSAGA